ncbi:hypothetical protein HHK36_025319 [Tetracentron sinense]|uniref:Uncharacterized protein n=1 Tax=Tetracentron sinense TaxID=13715 RepID=A0A834YPU9_TETSI|nr:hypothetical protein HHK36_025319 [Tetracentron sinense]
MGVATVLFCEMSMGCPALHWLGEGCIGRSYLKIYKKMMGDYVDVKVNGAVHKVLLDAYFHLKFVTAYLCLQRNSFIGACSAIKMREEFKLRKIRNDELKADAKARGVKISTKRQPEGPKPGFMEGATLETVTPIPYDVVNDLKGGY